MGRWLGPLAGLAVGLGLAQMFGHATGSLIVALLCAGILVAAVVFLMRMIGRSRPAAAALGTNGAPYSGFGDETVAAPPPSQLMTQPIAVAALLNARNRIPEGFNVEGFLREAKKNFIELYAAHDRADLDTLREFTTDEMFAELKREVEGRAGVNSPVDIVTLGADLLEMVTEADTRWASIRFSGMLRENRNGVPSSFEEIWNLRRPVSGPGGWVLAGIQQVN
jgi:predicted lipid-binding transport protein (Tim44 family)